MAVPAGGSRIWARARRYRGHVLLGAIVLLLMASAGVTMSARSQKAAREQFERRGRYIAENLAYNSRYLLAFDDRREELTALVEAVRASSPDVAGAAVFDFRGRILVQLGEVDERSGSSVTGVFRAPVVRTLGTKLPRVIGEVQIRLRRQHNGAAEERQARADHIAGSLAHNLAMDLLGNVPVKDAYTAGGVKLGRVTDLLKGVMETAPDVAGIVVRGRTGRVLARAGESWTTEPSGASFTDTLQRVTPLRARVSNGEDIPQGDARHAEWEAIAEVEVAVREPRETGVLSDLRSRVDDLIALLNGTARRLLSHRLPSSMEA